MTNALNNALSILSDEEATQEDIDQAVASLQTSIDNLVEKDNEPPTDPEVDISELEELVEYARTLSSTDYTEKSFAEMTNALNNALSILSDEATQEDVDQAVASLQTTIDNLVEKENEPPTDPEVDVSEFEKDKVKITDDESGDKVGKLLPSTATKIFLFIFVGGLLIAGGALLFWARGKIVNN